MLFKFNFKFIFGVFLPFLSLLILQGCINNDIEIVEKGIDSFESYFSPSYPPNSVFLKNLESSLEKRFDVYVERKVIMTPLFYNKTKLVGYQFVFIREIKPLRPLESLDYSLNSSLFYNLSSYVRYYLEDSGWKPFFKSENRIYFGENCLNVFDLCPKIVYEIGESSLLIRCENYLFFEELNGDKAKNKKLSC